MNDYPKKGSSGNGTQIGYTVEARSTSPRPLRIDDLVFDIRWNKVHFPQGPVGVPSCAPHQKMLLDHGMLGYSAAQALRWWLHAEADAKSIGGSICLETKIVEHRIKYSFENTAVAESSLMQGDRPAQEQAKEVE